MKQFLLLVSFLSWFLTPAAAQDFPGYSGGNYSGYQGHYLQPASIVDSRFLVDVQLIGFHASVGNNYFGVSREALPSIIRDKADVFATGEEQINNQDKAFWLNTSAYMPGFMLTLSEKDAIAVGARARSMLNIDGVSADLAKIIKEELEYPDLWLKPMQNGKFSIQSLTWSEFSATYARVLMDRGNHFLKAGITPKAVQGAMAFYMYAEDITFMFQNADTLTIFESQVNYGHSDGFEFIENPVTFVSKTKMAPALDLGVVYEWRPKHQEHRYDMDGETNLWRKNNNKYKLRVGASLTDLGRLKFKKGPYSNDFHASITNWDIQHIDFTDVDALDDTLIARFPQDNTEGTFTMRLPTALSLQLDYHVWKGFYLNFTPFYAFKFEDVPHKVHGLTNYSLTPRWEHKWLGVYVPASLNEYGQTRVGLDLMFGPFAIGTNDILAMVASDHIYAIDLHMFMRLPLYFPKRRDRDKDAVSDKLDKCIDVPGVWEFYGCPDRDGDHIEDALDNCPDDAGPAETNGCPDKDRDGIADRIDECPEQAGSAQHNGCPDTDGDGIVDRDDRCPQKAGPAEMSGCPDTDGDKIADYEDLCPDKAGPFHNLGCPETKLFAINKNGEIVAVAVRDNRGEFIFENLPADENLIFRIEGEDTDYTFEVKVKTGSRVSTLVKHKDGFFTFEKLKSEDLAINPMDLEDVAIKLLQEEENVVNKAFEDLEFATGRDKIEEKSQGSLDELAELLSKNPSWRIKLSGHTDNTGNYNINMILSKKRAEAVANYLQQKGIARERMEVYYHGDTMPVADNSTDEGKQKNRRVEMNIIR